ncbi:hypothetical protein [Phyllobacterium phragmitis]|uniref:hypothetical protein n=1 Tax=Phyllobacterium phragmitis TaxID=2670329 RepID=UPI0038B2CDD5
MFAAICLLFPNFEENYSQKIAFTKDSSGCIKFNQGLLLFHHAQPRVAKQKNVFSRHPMMRSSSGRAKRRFS